MQSLEKYPIIYQQSVAWGDMDAFGHVNNVVYYRYIESARIEYLNALHLFDEEIYSVVASSQCQYLKPLFFPDQLKIGARVVEMRNSAVRMEYLLWSEKQQLVVALAEAVIVFVDPVQLKKMPIPEKIRQQFIQLEQKVNRQILISN
ncbi:thioesterase family protein [Acinetobacter sp. MD2(2019)]|uniref:acyl-CoA thioesterase n=1 Tax=Acinetobacter sp. MD2(2019) TaxID=2605273 RepID=UPI002D1E599E|nr:thioesterase family protein [Acinetobacter sp. MD2(2019)]MEB3754463.1 acyl-CoA thioesterase [Acinetobacter sp. MD2(2019)]